MATNDERKRELERLKTQSLKNLAKVRFEERQRNAERVKEAKAELMSNLEAYLEKPTSLGGQHCGMPVYPFIVKSEVMGIEIKINHFRSNFQNRDLAMLLMELAMDELIK